MNDKFEEYLRSELSEIKAVVKQISTKDIPDLYVSVAILKKEASFSSKIYSTVGGAVAFISAYIAMKFDHR